MRLRKCQLNRAPGSGSVSTRALRNVCREGRNHFPEKRLTKQWGQVVENYRGVTGDLSATSPAWIDAFSKRASTEAAVALLRIGRYPDQWRSAAQKVARFIPSAP